MAREQPYQSKVGALTAGSKGSKEGRMVMEEGRWVVVAEVET